MKYGRYGSFEEFLQAYTAAERAAERQARTMDLSLEVTRARARRRERDIVEIQAAVVEYPGTESGGGDSHQHIIIGLTTVIQGDPDVATDLERVRLDGERVFVSIRYGDRMGLEDPVPGVVPGLELHLRGEWIPRDKAYAHGGEKMSVLHFTHHPVGFVCTPSDCYR
ncbi:hypothetical protein [Azospirillum sp. TSO22-1]|uniref:hypothetical protein n=1 Tax=Azospirillum sp. TSO22-1 TaxID=716789 RepID=UPI000D646F9B|nr:hypothetical protein [Azospirillum sp. TSO22-1]